VKEPIEPSDIRKGDLIRWEADGKPGGTFVRAVEYAANGENDEYDMRGQHYLIARHTLGIPHQPALGWVNTKNHGPSLGFWRDVPIEGRAANLDNSGQAYGTLVTANAFTPATAVPTSALDELRLYVTGLDDLPVLRAAERAVARFIEVVDEAQS
jgi:hypothetical protein